MAFRHSPGPWLAEPFVVDADGTRFAYVQAEDGFYVATVAGDCDDATAAANASVIAVAPALLEALRAAVTQCRCSTAERDSGHVLGCFAPSAIALLERVEAA